MSYQMDARWLHAQPLESATALPAPVYVDDAALVLERQAIFARSWQLFARADQLCDVGDHVVGEVAGTPVIAVRGDDGQLRALHNVCRHRAGPLATCDGRAAQALRCKYHGWTYRLDGQLRSAPEMDSAAAFNVADIRLPQAQICQWNGLIFVALRPSAPLTEVFDGIDARVAGHALDAYVFDRRVSYEIACNWKVYIDNFLEGYHIPHIHPALNRMLDYRSYSTQTHVWNSLQHSALESTEGIYADGEALYYFVWPNCMLNILPGRMQTNCVVPLAVDRCRVDFDFFYATGGDTTQRSSDRDFSNLVQAEDVAICEQVQRNLASGSYLAGRLNPRRENGVHHFQELWRRAARENLELKAD